jgi:hypothetical protein
MASHSLGAHNPTVLPPLPLKRKYNYYYNKVAFKMAPCHFKMAPNLQPFQDLRESS